MAKPGIEKGYRKETLASILSTLLMLINMYKALSFENLKLHISKGNRKIGYTHNFSMAPGHTCANCTECIRFCYDVKACWQYENVRKARAENTAMMLIDMAGTFELIDKYISTRKKHKYFRWHVSGDILNVEYFAHMVAIARKHPDWIFWTYTKNYYAVNAWIKANGGNKNAIPKNLSVMFSVWNGMPCINPYGLPEFTCIMPGMDPDPDAWTCPGNCQTCIAAGRGCPYGESSQVDLH